MDKSYINKQKVNIKNIAVGSSLALGFMGVCSNADLIEKQIITIIESLSEENILNIVLDNGKNIPVLANNPDGHTKMVVSTINGKKLDSVDFSNLALSTIPSIDLNDADADRVPNSAFSGKTCLKSFVFPRGIVSIGDSAFQGCNNLAGNLNIPSTVTTIGSRSFYNCYGFVGDLNIPNSVVSIGSYAFYNCYGLNGVLNIGSGLKTITEGMFSNCKNLTGDIIIPDNITNIHTDSTSTKQPFYKCDKLNGNLIIGSGLRTVSQYMFNGGNYQGAIYYLKFKLMMGLIK